MRRWISSRRWMSTSAFRTHTCGELRKEHALEQVKLSGWIDSTRRFGPITFVSLRDRYGITQIVFQNDMIDRDLKLESVVTVHGKVRLRPDDMKNKETNTGDIEVECSDLEMLNKSDSMPIKIGSKSLHDLPSEEVRLKHRHLDLRRPQMQKNLAIRSSVAMTARNYLTREGFLEIETPTLFKSTPEGAREFLVPTREKDAFYALTQSPQQYKQLLMVAGLDRYFQIARCYRDEGGRADRQPEFTQIDLEMSFIDQSHIQNLIEGLVCSIWSAASEHQTDLQVPSGPFPVMSYTEAISRFGSDKPDTRYGLEIVNLSDLFTDSNFPLFSTAETVQAINVTQLAKTDFSLKHLKELQSACQMAQVDGTSAFAFKIDENNQWKSSFAKQLSPESMNQASERLQHAPGDVVIIVAGNDHESVCTHLGRMRQHCAKELHQRGYLQEELRLNRFNLLWITDFPMFEREDGKIKATHHPFTAVSPSSRVDLEEILANPNAIDEKKLLNLQAQHLDLVCNGWELGGGSIRIHESHVQAAVMRDILDLPQAQFESFQHLLTALSQGCPPHGGIALGLDRLVAIICQASSLRDVIAFPKSTTGKELMTGSPSAVTPEQLAEYHL